MIKIVKGVYGFVDGNGIVRPKTEDDEPFELPPEKEARLVGLGVAVYVSEPVDEQAEETEQEETEMEESVDEQDPIGFDETPADERDLSEYTVKELREIGKEYGLTFKVGMLKDDMVKAIEAAEAALDAEDDESEDAPVFDASEAVQ